MPVTVIIGIILLGVVTIPIITAATGEDFRETPRLIREKSRQKYRASKQRLQPKITRFKQSLRKRFRRCKHCHERHDEEDWDLDQYTHSPTWISQKPSLPQQSASTASDSERATCGSMDWSSEEQLTKPKPQRQELPNCTIIVEGRDADITLEIQTDEMDDLGRPYDWSRGQHFRVDLEFDMAS